MFDLPYKSCVLTCYIRSSTLA